MTIWPARMPEFSESTSLDVLKYYLNRTNTSFFSGTGAGFLKDPARHDTSAKDVLQIRGLSWREQCLLQKCLIAIGANQADIVTDTEGPDMYMGSSIAIAQKFKAEGIPFEHDEKIAPSATARIKRTPRRK